MSRLTLRARLVVTTTFAALLTVALLVLGGQLLLDHITRSESLSVVQERADAAATTVRGTRGAVRVLDVPSDSLDQNLWIYDLHGSRVDGSRPTPLLAAAVLRLSRTGRPRSRIVAGRYRLFARPVAARGRGPVVAVVVAGVDLAPYESSERRGLWVSVALGVLVVVAAAAASWVAATYSLRQIRRMARRADDWREHDLRGRFALGLPRDEIGELAQTLDRMLDRIAEAILAERRLTDEVAHDLRNPLAVIRSEAQLALLQPETPDTARESLTAIVAATERVDGSIAAILAVARSAHSEDQRCTVGDVLAEVSRRAAAYPGVTVTVLPSDACPAVAAPQAVVAAALAPIVDNAARHARTSVVLGARGLSRRVLVAVDDDGAGVPEAEVELIFTPGHTSTDEGAGLGLALARRLAHSIGGSVRAEAAGHGRFVLDVPAA
jgi:two-component system, OmpR family, sensor kinase